MSITERVHNLVAYVEQGRIIEAIEEFYDDGVVMQENLNPPTVGKAANLERERTFVASIAQVHENRAGGVFVEGNRVVIHWTFEFSGIDGKRLRFDQVALQVWDGDRIISERFIYDPATLAAA
jgi:hypothetical protein